MRAGQDGSYETAGAHAAVGPRGRRHRRPSSEPEESPVERSQSHPDGLALPPPPWTTASDPADSPDSEPVHPVSAGVFPPLERSVSGDVRAANIRPYAWTGGRTKSRLALELETLVSTNEYQRCAPLRAEHESIAEFCCDPRSVAEVGAMLSVPLGVVKVLLADMAEMGAITVHQTVTDGGSEPHVMLMERVLSGLRRL